MPSPSSSSTGNATSVQVALRIRPTTSQDLTSIPARFQRAIIHSTSATSVSVDTTASAPNPNGAALPASPAGAGAQNKKIPFTFDQVHPPETSQHALYTGTAAPLVSRFLEGFNCTILAYGQTSSGKTYSMTGVDLDADPSDPTNNMGIIPRAVSTIFSKARELRDERNGSWKYTMKASFIEIYNEDLIDLLGVDDSTGARRDVQIREEKDGTIIWQGLREINVKNANEVMTLLKQGTSLRRTNETDMNAQSSRSHAIFSLTLTQKRYTGSSPIKQQSGRTSPMPSPSRLQRPGSMQYGASPGRIASPTPGRAPTPSFHSAINRVNGGSTGGLRPASSLGLRPRTPTEDDASMGEWVTVVSKFHFVDLAGSERIKRTGAAGERAKEGIAINGGLLALGNVISALGDPSRSRSLSHGAAIHVPYRDSKLTRLLQDSLGGNAHTVMVACVSPSEWNVSETVNTLKYANRARNIKNRAEIREKEEGWDDLDWLQNMVTRLRKELKALKEGGAIAPPSADAEEPQHTNNAVENSAAAGKVLRQYAELQRSYEEMRARFVERNEELAQLRKELMERTTPPPSAGGGARYEEIVGPVIEEYEKTISAMEAELKLGKTALMHTNEICEEQEAELNAAHDRNAAAEAHLTDLRARVVKLTEREASTESYIRDLELKLKVFSETTTSESESAGDLRKEIARFKESEGASTAYIAELEARLSQTDADLNTMRLSVEKLEKDLEDRDDRIQSLERRLDVFLREQQDAESWKQNLLEREKKVEELEKKMQELEEIRKEYNDKKDRLGDTVDRVEKARRSLQLEVAKADGSKPDLTISTNGSTAPNGIQPKINGHVDSHDPSATPASRSPSLSSPTDIADPANLREELDHLQKAHSDTLSDLTSITAKYRDALREISDLAAQVTEVKLQLNQDQCSDSSSDAGAPSKPPKTPVTPSRSQKRPSSRGATWAEGSSPVNGTQRRPFFRSAASTESLHSRSQSQLLSSELSSAYSRRPSWAAAGPGGVETLLKSRPTTPGARSPGQFPGEGQRSVSSLEKEVMRLQEVLKEREAEIAALESSIQQSEVSRQTPSVPAIGQVDSLPLVKEEHEHDPASSMPRTPTTAGPLSAETMDQFVELRQRIGQQQPSKENEGETLNRLDELMRSMAQKESAHREVVDSLTDQLEGLRRQHDELTALSQGQALNMSTQAEKMTAELDSLRTSLGETSDQNRNLEEELGALRKRENDLVEARRVADEEHSLAIKKLQLEHSLELKKFEEEAAQKLAAVHDDHKAMMARIVETHEAALQAVTAETHHSQETADNTQGDVEAAVALAVANLQQVHERTLEELKTRQVVESESKLSEAHQAALAQLRSEHEAHILTKDSETSAFLRQAQQEYDEQVRQKELDHATALQRLREEHAAELKSVTAAREGLLSDTQAEQNAAIEQLLAEHSASSERKDAAYAADLAKTKADHEQLLKSIQGTHAETIKKLTLDHERAFEALVAEKIAEIESVNAALQANQQQHQALRDEMESAISLTKTEHEATLRQRDIDHQGILAELKADHHTALLESHDSLARAREQHEQALDELRQQHEHDLREERDQQLATLEDLEVVHNREKEELIKEHDALEDELSTLKQATDQASVEWAETRKSHEATLNAKDEVISSLQAELTSVDEERTMFADEIERLRKELQRALTEQSKLAQEASNRESLAQDLERHRAALSELQGTLQQTKAEVATLQAEKTRQDQTLKDLQSQLSSKTSEDGHLSQPPRSALDRSINRLNGIPAAKPPPLSPPPSIPPPPIPAGIISHQPDASISSATTGRTSSGSRGETTENDASTIGTSVTSPSNADSRLYAQLEEQARHLDEQDVMIKTLNKQLTHCESDLQAHMDLVATLETSLTDSERNLRKARIQANEYAKERDALNGQIDVLRIQLQEAQHEVVSVRRSIVEEKQNLEYRLDEERRAKERARAQLDSRMDEMQKRKSKFACI